MGFVLTYAISHMISKHGCAERLYPRWMSWNSDLGDEFPGHLVGKSWRVHSAKMYWIRLRSITCRRTSMESGRSQGVVSIFRYM
ncbi:hypothetical protein BJX68DRAFT_239081 [Aspergillus pseudodeflectus]|uniref:Uncharacterized protein n=1 Tax=Aspergillus pseudodeflectus TaxID=176178 RepID=A0ABR4K9D7_9EURO